MTTFGSIDGRVTSIGQHCYDLADQAFVTCQIHLLLRCENNLHCYPNMDRTAESCYGFSCQITLKLTIWAIAVLSLPIRSLTALQRERALEMHLQEMQIEFENLVWERKQLEKKILVAIKDKKIMQAMLAELEDEHDDAIVKIEQLEDQLDNVFPFRHVFLATSKKMDLIERDIEVNWSQKAVASICYNGPLKNLKVENQRLNEVHGKALSDLEDHFDGPVMQGCSDAVPFWRSSGIESVAIHKEGMQEDNSKNGSTSSEFVEARSCRDVNRPRTQTTFEYFDTNDVLQQRRDLAVSQTLFSAILSLLVGTIIWKAEDACMPLVLALFAVVGMSLWSVVQFFSTIRNRPASDAVALLSFNWFLLGTLTYPTLPRITPVFAPVLWTLSDRAVELLGF